MKDITNAHTHDFNANNALICTSPDNFTPKEGKFYSVGIHPWETASCTEKTLQKLLITAAHPQVLAIGETGLDKLKGASIEQQTKIFQLHIELSESLHKPIVLHAVKTLDLILRLKKEMNASMPWIWHGFRGNAPTAHLLVGKGIYLSIGEKSNSEAVKCIPDDFLLIENDESLLDIKEIAARIASIRNTTTTQICNISARNLNRLLAATAPLQ